MQIREFKISDQSAVIDLWTKCALVVPWNNPARDIERKMKVDPDLFLVGEAGGRIIASVMGGYEGHRGWINYLAVSPDLQGGGYGQQMMEAVEQRLKGRGCPKINLQVRGSNTNVITFYESIGYRQDEAVSLGKRLESDE